MTSCPVHEGLAVHKKLIALGGLECTKLLSLHPFRFFISVGSFLSWRVGEESFAEKSEVKREDKQASGCNGDAYAYKRLLFRSGKPAVCCTSESPILCKNKTPVADAGLRTRHRVVGS